MMFLGIDPGLKGGLALIYAAKIQRADVMPVVDGNIDCKALYDIVDEYKFYAEQENEPLTAIIEKVGAMPKQGVASTFKFGVGYGSVQMCVVSHGLPLILVPPRQWQSFSVGSPSKTAKPKERSRSAATRLFPNFNFTPEKCRTPHDGLIDASLIAFYGYSIFKVAK